MYHMQVRLRDGSKKYVSINSRESGNRSSRLIVCEIKSINGQAAASFQDLGQSLNNLQIPEQQFIKRLPGSCPK